MSSNAINNLHVMNNGMASRHKCQGFTLLEALIGFLILSIGMLGIASLQAISLKAGKTSVYGSVAMMKVDELIESMRANPSALALAEYTGAGANNGCTGVKECSDVELAQDDVFRWKQDLTVGLPSTATTTVVYTPAAAPSKLATMNITVNWDERDKDSSGSVSKSYTTTVNICTVVPC
jgi:type IV pilus assembly protein PilV